MMYTLSILVFMLVHGRVVCDSELFPVSMFKDVDESEPSDLPENDETESPQGRSTNKGFKDVKLDPDVEWIRREIVENYEFTKKVDKVEWKEQPNFEAHLGTANFKAAGNRAKQFFKCNNHHDSPWKNFLQTRSPTNLLYITAARYLLVTYILYEVSNGKLIPCKETRKKDDNILLNYEIPGTGVCFPGPCGSCTYKSDYDVGLIGKDSGTVTKRFNVFFQCEFGKPSELVFDTNVYAFTLEFAMPLMFLKLPNAFPYDVAELEQTVNYKMQELASAYYKVFKYAKWSFEYMTKEAMQEMEQTAKQKLEDWLKTFRVMNDLIPMKIGKNQNLEDFRQVHNNHYQALVGFMSQNGGYEKHFIENVAKALLYAAEAYHTRGAIRHVVGYIQIKKKKMENMPLSIYDLWVSMIENWGEANKEYQHCGNIVAAECLVKMSKYLSRMFNAMKLLRQRERITDRYAITITKIPESTTLLWLQYKKKGRKLTPQEANKLFDSEKTFLQRFTCYKMMKELNEQPLSRKCLRNIHLAVNDYNTKLAKRVTGRDGKGL